MVTGDIHAEYSLYNRRVSDRLSERAERWLDNLPPHLRPGKLVEARPLIVNQIAHCWNSEDLCRRYLHRLAFQPSAPLPHPIPVSLARELVALYNFRFPAETG